MHTRAVRLHSTSRASIGCPSLIPSSYFRSLHPKKRYHLQLAAVPSDRGSLIPDESETIPPSPSVTSSPSARDEELPQPFLPGPSASIGESGGETCSSAQSPVTETGSLLSGVSGSEQSPSANAVDGIGPRVSMDLSGRELEELIEGVQLDGISVPSASESLSGIDSKQVLPTSSIEDEAPSPQPASLLQSRGLLRQIAVARGAPEALELLLKEAEGRGVAVEEIVEGDCAGLISAALEQGNPDLAQSIYSAMTAAGRSSSASQQGLAGWPPATLLSVQALVLGLTRSLRVADAIRGIDEVRRRGVPKGEEVPFGHVVACPLPPYGPLAVVQPQEGLKLVADSETRFEFELFSGEVISVKSEAIDSGQGWLLNAARSLGIWRKPPMGALHELVVQSPDGRSRTFRFGTQTADVPGQQGDRVTVVCSPGRGRGRRAVLSAAPPGTRPGEPMSFTNHLTGDTAALLRPPSSQSGLPSWWLTASVVLAGSDAATAFIDPTLPAIVAVGIAGTLATGLVGTQWLLPKLKQLPESSLSAEAVQQRLLAQHSTLTERITDLADVSADDVRTLARLYQLQNKMEAVGAVGAYDARLERVLVARSAVEERLVKRLDLIDGFARVVNMIEIEVEMDVALPAAEADSMADEISRLLEVQDLQSQWQIAAEASDEVERLLRAI